MALQDVVDRLPILAGAFHGDNGAASGLKPVQKQQQLAGHRRKGAGLDQFLPLWIQNDPAGDHRPFMNVQACATYMNNLHATLSVHDAECGG